MVFHRFVPYVGYMIVGAGGVGVLQQTISFTSSGDGERFSLANRIVPTRAQQLSRLRQFTKESPCDVLIIGGGATGAGSALDAAARCVWLPPACGSCPGSAACTAQPHELATCCCWLPPAQPRP
jgi:hypothetical protein